MSPTAVYRGEIAARSELRSQLERLEESRQSLSEQVRGGELTGADKSGIESRLVEVDKRIGDAEKQIAAADQAVTKAARVPGANTEVPRPVDVYRGPPDGAFLVGALFIIVVMLPISLAIARRIWRRGKEAVVAFPQELAERLNRLDQSVDSIAIEVERIGEGQRFVTRVLSETGSGRSVGSGAAQPLEMPAREGARATRGQETGRV